MYRYRSHVPVLRCIGRTALVATRTLSSTQINQHTQSSGDNTWNSALGSAPLPAEAQAHEPQSATSTTVKNSSSMSSTNVTMRSLYRRLLKAGEDTRMMRHCVSVHTPQASVKYGLLLLRLHKNLTNVDARSHLSLFRPFTRARCALLRRYYAARLLAVRIQLRSINAFSDVLVYLFLLTTAVLLYQIYKTCRIGIDRAEDRYRTLAIPIVQTFEALEAAQQRKKALRAEMDADILRSRNT